MTLALAKRRRRLNQPEFLRLGYGGSTARRSELAVDACEMGLDGVARDVQRSADFAQRQIGREEFKDLHFAGGQGVAAFPGGNGPPAVVCNCLAEGFESAPSYASTWHGHARLSLARQWGHRFLSGPM